MEGRRQQPPDLGAADPELPDPDLGVADQERRRSARSRSSSATQQQLSSRTIAAGCQSSPPVMDLSSPAFNRQKGGLNLPLVSSNFDGFRSKSPVMYRQPSSGAVAAGHESTPNAHTEKPSGGLNDSEQVIPSSSEPISYAAKVRPTMIKKPDFPAYGLRTLHSKREGEVVTLSIPKSEYQQRLDEFQFALIGRMILRKGDKPRTFADITLELQRIWQCSDCQFIPMAKGFFTIKFKTLEAKKKAKGNAVFQLSTGHIRLREWCRYFDPYKETSSLAQVWVRVYYLPVELWTPVIIANIGRALGHPLRIDNVSANGQVGHFARVLVEINMALPLLNSMYIDDGNNSFYIEFGFESLPLFCSSCKITGHSTDKCRRSAKEKGKQKNEEAADKVEENHKGDAKVDPKPAWQPKEQVFYPNVKDSDLPSIGLENRYGVLHKDDEKVAETDSDRVDENFVVESPHMSLNEIGKVSAEHLNADGADDFQEDHCITKRHDLSAGKGATTFIGDEDSGSSKGQHGEEVVTSPNMQSEDIDELQVQKEAAINTQREKDPTPDLKDRAESEGIIPDQEDIANRISRLEAQVSQGMELLVEQVPPKRGPGRPKKGMERSRVPLNPNPVDYIKGRLRNAEELGYKPRDFVVDHSNNSAMRAMNNIAHGRWSDEMELDDFHTNKDFPY